MSYHIAVDIGASSGRVILLEYNNNFTCNEIHRFKNEIVKKNNYRYWNIDYIYEEILEGLRKAKNIGVDNTTLGIDTWAVDYVLLDSKLKKLDDPISYRDNRTDNVIYEFESFISKKELYEKTGIQILKYNTIFQLYREDKEKIKKVSKILMIPDYINFLLTGKMWMEMTNASTTQLLNYKTKDFDLQLLEKLNITKDKFPELIESGKYIGGLKHELNCTDEYPKCKVIAVASHDTASAVLSIPFKKHKNWAFISSGTWSLIGKVTNYPVVSDNSFKLNYSNEYGAYKTYRFLKNICGMWIIQRVMSEIDRDLDYKKLNKILIKLPPFRRYIDINDDRFFYSENMIKEIKNYYKETNQEEVEDDVEIIMDVYSSLAFNYKKELDNLEEIFNQKIDTLHIIGGGSEAEILNQITANLLDINIISGPKEGSSIGNLVCQMICEGIFKDMDEARKFLIDNLDIITYKPNIKKKLVMENNI